MGLSNFFLSEERKLRERWTQATGVVTTAISYPPNHLPKKAEATVYDLCLPIECFHSCDETAMLVYKTIAKISNKFCIIIVKFPIVLYINMAAVTLCEHTPLLVRVRSRGDSEKSKCSSL